MAVDWVAVVVVHGNRVGVVTIIVVPYEKQSHPVMKARAPMKTTECTHCSNSANEAAHFLGQSCAAAVTKQSSVVLYCSGA